MYRVPECYLRILYDAIAGLNIFSGKQLTILQNTVARK